jgi:recombination protein RecT
MNTATKPQAAASQTASQPERVHPLRKLREQLDTRMEEFSRALPPTIKPDHFISAILTAVQNNQALLLADRQSLWNACMRAAHDGLLPDGREGAIVVYKTKVKDNGVEKWIKKAQWMPMVYGIIKKIRNSGEVSVIDARVVYGGDDYRCWIEDGRQRLNYEASDSPDRNIVRRVFAYALLKTGELMVEELYPNDIEKIRSVSKAKDDGPWVEWWEEMSKKSGIRRLSKRLPMSPQLDDLVRRDDDLYNLAERPALPAPDAQRPQTIAAAFDNFADGIEQVPADEVTTAPEATTKPEKPKKNGSKEAGTTPAPDQDPEGFIAAIQVAVSAAKDAAALDAVRKEMIEPVKASIFPPDMAEIEKMIKAREQEFSA